MVYIISVSIILLCTLILYVLGKKTNNNHDNRKSVIAYISKYKKRMAFGAIIKIAGTVMELILPYLLSYVLDYVVPDKSVKNVILFSGLMVLCAIFAFIFNAVANRLAAGVARLVTKDLRRDTFSKILSLSSAQLDDVTIPSLVSRMTSDTYNIHHMTGMIQRIGIRAPILLVGGIFITISLDVPMTLILVALLPFLVLTTFVISKKSIPIFTTVQERVDSMVQTIRENISGIRVIRALSKGDYEKERFEKVNKNLIEYELKSGYQMAKLNPITTTLLNFGLVCVIVLGAYRVNGGHILPGKVLAFTTYFTTILNALLTITRIFIIITKSMASGARINYVLNLPEDLVVEDLDEVESIYHIEFNNVSFSYNKKVNNIENINFKLKQGESLGIIGATGSGKSTIIQLLMRFYDVDEGEILINGKNIKAMNKQELKSMFGVVFQNDTIFSNTIRENIMFGRDYTEDELIKASKVAQAYDFIQKQPDGFNTILSAKGTNLSGGQKQRVLISRALIGNPNILILDDASSALDYKTDAALRKGIKEYFSDTTSIIITQRISSIINCDHILVIDDGYVVGYGSHEELLKSVDIYKDIYNIQMGGGVDNE